MVGAANPAGRASRAVREIGAGLSVSCALVVCRGAVPCGARLTATRTTITNTSNRTPPRSPAPRPTTRWACTSRGDGEVHRVPTSRRGTLSTAVQCGADHGRRPDAHDVRTSTSERRDIRDAASRACVTRGRAVRVPTSTRSMRGSIPTGPNAPTPSRRTLRPEPARKRAICPILTGESQDVRLTRCEHPAGRQFQSFGISRPPSCVSGWLSRGRVSVGSPSARLWSICAGCRMCAQ